MNQDIENTLADIAEMTHEKYLCSVGHYDAASEEFEITWVNKEGRECGFWGTQRLIEQMFTQEILN